MQKNLINNMLNESAELLSQGQTIVEWFTPANKDHMAAYKTFLETKAWPVGAVPEGVSLTPGWEGQLAQKISEKSLTERTTPRIGDTVQIMDKEGNTTVVPSGKVVDVDTMEPDGVPTVQLEGSEDWYDGTTYLIKILEPATEGKAPSDKDDSEEKIIQKLTEAGIKENEVRDIWIVTHPDKETTSLGDIVHKTTVRNLVVMAKTGVDVPSIEAVYDNEVEARKKGSALLNTGVAEKKVNEIGPTDDVQPGVPNKDFQPGADVGEEPVPDELEPGDEHEAVEADFDKVYLGQNDTTHFYVVAKKGDSGETENLQITDQEGKELFSAKENELDPKDVAKFILAALDSEKVRIAELERDVVMQYLVPQKEEEIEAEEEEGEELGGEEMPLGAENEPKEDIPPSAEKTMKGVKPRESKVTEKKLSETLSVKDDKGNTFSIQIIDEGSKDVVVQINNREFRFKPEFAALYEMDGGKLTEQGLQDLAQEVLGHLDTSEYAEVVGSGVQEDRKEYPVGRRGYSKTQSTSLRSGRTKDQGAHELFQKRYEDLTSEEREDVLQWLKERVQEDLNPSVTQEVGEDTLLQRAQQLRAKKDRSPDDDATLQQLEDELKTRGQKDQATEGKAPSDVNDDEQKMVQKLTEENLNEPAGFQSCVDRGGRVRTVSGADKEHGLAEGEYVKYCYIGKESFRGEIHKKSESKVTEAEKDGLAKKAGKKSGDFDKEQLAAGTKVEMEHTDDQSKAQQIAMDHLTEDPKYYMKLKKMETGKCGEAKMNEKGWFYRAVDELKADPEFQHTVKKHGSDSDEVYQYVTRIQGFGTDSNIADIIKAATGQVTEREYSDMTDDRSKNVFQVEFVLQNGEKKSTRVMAFDENDAKVMMKRNKDVKDVTMVKKITGHDGSNESKVNEAKRQWAGADWKDIEGFVESVKAALPKFGLHVVDDPSMVGSDTYGILISDELIPELKNHDGVLAWLDEEEDSIPEETLGPEGEEPSERRSVQIAKDLLGLKEAKVEEELVKVGDLVQIVDANSFRVEVEEATVKALDEKKGVEITGSTVPDSQKWYRKPYWNVFLLERWEDMKLTHETFNTLLERVLELEKSLKSYRQKYQGIARKSKVNEDHKPGEEVTTEFGPTKIIKVVRIDSPEWKEYFTGDLDDWLENGSKPPFYLVSSGEGTQIMSSDMLLDEGE